MQNEEVVEAVRRWVDSLVVGLNICPFAKRELVKGRVQFIVRDALSEEQLQADLQEELNRLDGDPSMATSLLIHPCVLTDFGDYTQFLDRTENLIVRMELEGVFQIASFHLHYQFADTEPSDFENFANRSPYPMLHLLREQSLERAIAEYPNVDQIPSRNIELMRNLGREKLEAILLACIDDAGQASTDLPTKRSRMDSIT